MTLPELPPPPVPKHAKLGGYDFYRSIGSPKWVIAPMVDQSELAWRLLSRAPLPPDFAGPSTSVTTPQGRTIIRHPGGAHLCYTPMIHAKVFVNSREGGRGSDGQFNLTWGEEGSDQPLAGIEGGDRPLIVQFCANDPEILLAAAKRVEKHCDAVDINFGCPQGIARRGNYGSFLQDDWELIHRLISTLHVNLSVPVTAKFRLHPDPARTLAYAKMMEAAGAQILTCHGRTREQKGQNTGLADWEMIRRVKEAVKIPVFANGNILYAEDVDRCLEVTGCDGVMTAEGNLSNPALFIPPSHPHFHPPITLLANRYLDIVSSLSTPTANSAVKSHLFRILKPALDTDETLRNKVGRCTLGPGGGIETFREIVREIEEKLKPEMDKAKADGWTPPPIDSATGYKTLPIWAAQPLIRPIPVSSEVGGNEELVNEEIGAAPGTVSSSRAPSPPPTNTAPPCPIASCGSMSAIRCPHGLCLLHCRIRGAVSGGATESEAASHAKTGGLVGMGCEAHEDKARARTERMAEKRKNRQEGKRVMKAMRLDAKRAKKAEQAQSQVQARPHGQVQPKESGKGLERMDLSGIRTTHGVDWDEVEKAVDAEEEAIANAAAGS